MINVYLIQPNYRTGYGDNTSAWFPYSVGTCWTYAVTNPIVRDAFVVAEIIYTREDINQIVADGDDGVYLFSNYVWNYEYNKILSKRLKDAYPTCTIVFGGPAIPKADVSEIPHVDYIVYGNGEQALMNIMVGIATDEPTDRILTIPMRSVEDVPSPYLTGLFDDIVKTESRSKMRATLETNRGCPFACTFCDWGNLSYNKVQKFPMEKVMAEIKWFANNRIKLVNIADANVGMFAARDEEILTEMVRQQKETGFPSVIDGAWYKNSPERVLDLAKITTSVGNNKAYTLSMQTLNPETSVAIKRKNLSFDGIKNILTKADEGEIRTYSEFIIGLPYETYDTWVDGFMTMLEAGQHSHLDAWLCQMLVNSELSTPESYALHGIETVRLHNYIGAVGQFDDIDEEYVVINATKYMPFEDLVEGYMFAWLVINFHIKGWTHVYSRFLRRHRDTPYKTYYLDLFDRVRADDGIVGREYRHARELVVGYLTTGTVDTWVPGSALLYVSTKTLSQNADEVKEFLRQPLGINNDALEQSVVMLQESYVASPFVAYPSVLKLDYNIPEYITRGVDLVLEPVSYDLALPNIDYLRMIHEQGDLDVWYAMLFYRSKSGWGKVSVSAGETSYLR